MNSLKAILAGCVFIIVVVLCMQMVFIMVAVGYNALAKTYPLLIDISGLLKYLTGIPVFIAIMFAGGYITASVAGFKSRMKIQVHCMTVGLIATAAIMYPALENASLTMTGIIVFLLALAATAAGGLYRQKN